MGQSSQVLFTFKELAEMMVKHQGIHEGFWGVYVEFGIKGLNVTTETATLPAALVPINRVGLQRFDVSNELSVDASIVNPE
jgi:hypothetical protein